MGYIILHSHQEYITALVSPQFYQETMDFVYMIFGSGFIVS